MVSSLRHNDWLEKASRVLKSEKVFKQYDCGNEYSFFPLNLSSGIFLLKDHELTSAKNFIFCLKTCFLLINLDFIINMKYNVYINKNNLHFIIY